MVCPKCNSENIQVQTRKDKNPILWGFVLAFFGIGLMFLGLVGAAIGAVLGLVVGAIAKGLMKDTHSSMGVCQNCGHVFNL